LKTTPSKKMKKSLDDIPLDCLKIIILFISAQDDLRNFMLISKVFHEITYEKDVLWNVPFIIKSKQRLKDYSTMKNIYSKTQRFTELYVICYYNRDNLQTDEDVFKYDSIRFNDNDLASILLLFPNLKRLTLIGEWSEYITSIPNVKGLLYLFLEDCESICKIPKIKGLQYLYINNCKNITFIRNFKSLLVLSCMRCNRLVEISNLTNAREITCYYNKNLTIFSKNNNAIFKNIGSSKNLIHLIC